MAEKMPAAAALDVARQEHARMTRVLEMLEAATAAEQITREAPGRIDKLKRDIAAAEADCNRRVDACLKAVQEAEEGKDRALERIRHETEIAEAALRGQLAELQAEVQREQTRLLTVQESRLTATAQIEAEVQLLRDQRYSLTQDIAALKSRVAAV